MLLQKFALVCVVSVGLGGCYATVPDPKISVQDSKYLAMVPRFDVEVDFLRYQVDYATTEAPGTVIVDTSRHFL